MRFGQLPENCAFFPADDVTILPGLLRCEEIDAGIIADAPRLTASLAQEAYVWPACHHAGSMTDADVPPMG